MKAIRIFLLAILAAAPLLGGLMAETQEIIYFVDICRFVDSQDQPYVEAYVNLDARTLHYVSTESGRFTAGVEIQLEIHKDQTEGEILWEQKVQLMSPELSDTTAESVNFSMLDIRRIPLNPGKYVLTGMLTDIHSEPKREHRFVLDVIIDQPKEVTLSLSDIEFITAFAPSKESGPHVKNGYSVMPMATNMNFVDQDSLHFYVEIYHADKELEGAYLVNAYITPANSLEKMPGYQRVFRKTAKAFDLMHGSFAIDKLPGNSYYLHLDVYNTKNQLVGNASQKFYLVNSRVAPELADHTADFDRDFNLTDEELDMYLLSLQYVSTKSEQGFTNTLSSVEDKKNYFYAFWEKRKELPTDPITKAWTIYKSRVDYANQHFDSAHLKGFRTDRGRILCVYGAPNDVDRQPTDNSRYPHEIWRYNKLGTQSNVMFVFYDSDLATNEYPLLHSNKLGEYNNPRWKLDLVKRNVNDGNFDNEEPDGFIDY